MREGELHVTIRGMLLRANKVLGGRLRYPWAVIVVLAVMVAGVVGFNQSADAASYDSEELQFL